MVHDGEEQPHDNLPIYAWEASLNEESIPLTSRVAATVPAKALCEVNHCPTESRPNNNNDVIAREVK